MQGKPTLEKEFTKIHCPQCGVGHIRARIDLSMTRHLITSVRCSEDSCWGPFKHELEMMQSFGEDFLD